MIGRLLAVLGLALATIVVVGAPARACSCQMMDTAGHADAATHVFVGSVTGSHSESQQRLTYDIDVSEVYKGDVPEVVALRSGAMSANCGLGKLPADRPIAFFATADAAGTLVSHSCSGTSPVTAKLTRGLSAAMGDPAKLNRTGAPTPHQRDATPAGSNGGDGAPLWPWLTVLLLAAIGAGAWTARRTT